jgi:two-component system cell cycle response regulator DivK
VALVLVVDDSAKNRKLARDVLHAAGFETLEAATAGDAIALARERLPNVVLLDLRLPDMDGADAAQRLRDDPRTAAIPVVAVSALPLEQSSEWLRAAGFAGWLGKPITIADFPEQVRRYCTEGRADEPGRGGC